VEVWFPRYGWLPFDPTPGRGTFDAAYSNASTSFDAGDAATLVAGAGVPVLSALERLRREQESEGGSGVSVSPAAEEPWRPGVVSAILLAALALVGLAAGGKAARRRLRYVTGDPRRIASACRREIAEVIADQRIAVPAGATTAELAAAIREALGIDPRGFVAETASARYGPPEGAGAAAGRARREVRGLRRAIRSSLTFRERLRGVLSLRSLRLPA
jgi:transglutaminase-like putative cysteine protease